MKTLSHFTTETVTVYRHKGYSFDEFKAAILKDQPEELWIEAWNSKRPFIQIVKLSETEVTLIKNDDSYGQVTLSWHDFYLSVKSYLEPADGKTSHQIKYKSKEVITNG